MKTFAQPTSFYIFANTECSRRSVEASKLSDYFMANGLHAARSPKKADLIIIYTCGGFLFAENFSVLTIEKILAFKNNATVIITGCLTKINPERLEKINNSTRRKFNNSIIVAPENLSILDNFIHAQFPYNKNTSKGSTISNIHDHYRVVAFNRAKYIVERIKYIGLNIDNLTGSIEELGRNLRNGSPTSVFAPRVYQLEIARGCLSNCSYCAIKLASERFHSFPEKQIVQNFKKGLEGKYRTFALVSGDIGCYGADIGATLPSLLEKLFGIDGNYKFILEDLNVRWLVKYYPELLSVLNANVDKISKVVFPIQSGSDNILRLMNRGYEIAEVKNCILDLHKSVPNLKLATHIIVGFPGETEEDFQKSLALIRTGAFSYVSVFCFENRPSTMASKLPNKVNKETIAKRVKLMNQEVSRACARASQFNPY